MSLCELFTTLPPSKQKEVVQKALVIYVNSLVNQGDIDTVRAVLDRAEKLGYLTPELADFKRKLDGIYAVVQSVNDLVGVLNGYQIYVEAGQYDRIDLEHLRRKISEAVDALNRYGNLLSPEQRQQALHVIDLARDFTDYVPLAAEAKSIESDFNKLLQDIQKSFESLKGKTLDEVITTLQTLHNKVNQIYNRLSPLYYSKIPDVWSRIRTGEYKDALKRFSDSVYGLLKYVVDLKEFLLRAFNAYVYLKNLDSLISSYGSDGNYLFNPGYRDRVSDQLANILRQVSALQSLSSSPNVGQAAKDLADTILDYLTSLKKSLVEGDFRWYDVFKRAEDQSGVKLRWEPPNYEELIRSGAKKLGDLLKQINPVLGPIIDALLLRPLAEQAAFFWNVGEQLDRALTSFVRDVHEANLMHFRSSNVWERILGTVGVVGAGALDTLTTVLRPSAIRDIINMLVSAAKELGYIIVSGNVQRLKEDVSNVVRAMFGTPEAALYTIGNILAVFAIAEAARSIPRLSPRLRAYIENILQGDPIGLTIAFISDPKVVSAFRTAVRKLAGAGRKLAEAVGESGVTRIVAEVSEKLLKERLGRFLETASRYLESVVRKVILQGEDVAKAAKEFKEAMAEVSVDEARKAALQYSDIAQRMIKEFGTERISELVDNAVKRLQPSRFSFVTPSVVRRAVTLEVVQTAIESAGEKLKTLGKQLGELENLVNKLKPLLGEQADRLLKEISDAREALGKMDVSYTMFSMQKISEALNSAKQTLSRYVESISSKLDIIKSIAGADVAERVSKILSDLSTAVQALDVETVGRLSARIVEELKPALEKLRSEIDAVAADLQKYKHLLGEANIEAYIKGLTSGKELAETLERVGATEGLRAIERINELLPKMQEISNIMLDARRLALEARTVFNSLRETIGGIFSEVGLTDLAKRMLTVEPEKFVNVLKDGVKEMLKKLDVATAPSVEKVFSVLTELSKNPKVSAALTSIYRELKELTSVSVNMPIEGLQRYAQELVDTLKKYKSKLPSDVADAIDILEEKVKARSVTLADIERISDRLAKLSPEVASLIDLGAVQRILSDLKRFLDGVCERSPTLAASFKSVSDKVTEALATLQRVGGREVVTFAAKELSLLPPELKAGFEALSNYLRESLPKLYDKYSSAIDTLIRKLEQGVVDSETVRAAEQVYNMFRELKDIGAVPSPIKQAFKSVAERLSSAIDTVLGKLEPAQRELAKSIKNMVDVIKGDIDKLGTLPEGWGYLYTGLERIKYTPVLAPQNVATKIREILSQRLKAFRAKIGDIEVELARKIDVLPDGTLNIEYTLKFPEDRVMSYRYTVRPAGKGVVDVYQRLYYDPPLAEALSAFKSGLTTHPLYSLGRAVNGILERGAEIIERLDPDFSLLKQIAVIPKTGGMVTLGKALVDTFTSLAPVMVAVGSALGGQLKTPQEQLWYYSLASDKLDLIRDLKPYVIDVSDAVKQILRSYGFEPVGAVPTTPTIVFVKPVAPRIQDIKSWTIVTTKDGKPIVAPTIPVDGQEVIVVPTVDIETEKVTLQNLDELLKSLKQIPIEIKKVEAERIVEQLKVPTIEKFVLQPTPVQPPKPVPVTPTPEQIQEQIQKPSVAPIQVQQPQQIQVQVQAPEQIQPTPVQPPPPPPPQTVPPEITMVPAPKTPAPPQIAMTTVSRVGRGQQFEILVI